MKFIILFVRTTTPTYNYWELRGKDGTPICRSHTYFGSEQETRSDIARVRKSMPGVKFAKVELDA